MNSVFMPYAKDHSDNSNQSHNWAKFLFQIYQNNQAAIDEVLGKVKVQLDEVKSKVMAVMPAQVTETMTNK